MICKIGHREKSYQSTKMLDGVHLTNISGEIWVPAPSDSPLQKKMFWDLYQWSVECSSNGVCTEVKFYTGGGVRSAPPMEYVVKVNF